MHCGESCFREKLSILMSFLALLTGTFLKSLACSWLAFFFAFMKLTGIGLTTTGDMLIASTMLAELFCCMLLGPYRGPEESTRSSSLLLAVVVLSPSGDPLLPLLAVIAGLLLPRLRPRASHWPPHPRAFSPCIVRGSALHGRRPDRQHDRLQRPQRTH